MGRLHSTAKLTATGAGMIALAALAACDGATVIGGGSGGGGGTSTGTSTGTGSVSTTKVDKVDIVVSVDNSRSMADKQAVLALALSDLVQSLTNPFCVDGQGIPAPQQPAGSADPCPAGTTREFAPIFDIHVGIISSSIGGHGSDACQTTETQSCLGQPNETNNDKAHLLSRSDACSGASVPTYDSQGFLAWDPTQKLLPPGDADANDFTSKFRTMVLGVGQVGCGYESQMESWYRFLADPDPYQSLTLDANKVTLVGTDSVLLQQRAKFLRPDSLLAILMLSDEDDCSTKESGQFYYSNQQQNPQDKGKKFHLPRARQICQTNPNDPCCMSCGQKADGCPADATCTASPTLSEPEDDINLRCFDQKRRFGIDFLYPIDRYTQALTSNVVANRQGDLVPNPIFTDLDPSDGVSAVRDPGLVVIAGIVGVPWQDIARDPTDLSLGFKTAEELAQPVSGGGDAWSVILGDPGNYVPPTDPHMIASVQPRAGIPGPSSAPSADPINGHDYTIANNDLQYACVFDLLAPRDCTMMSGMPCDCGPGNDNPLCDPMNDTTQVRAKAYPGQRELSLLKSVGPQGVVASICPSQLGDPTKADYAYRPAVAALVARVKGRLKL